MNKITSAIVAGALSVGALFGFVAAVSAPHLQTTFACEEDEVLGYHPRFGPSHVGCIHVDELAPSR